MNGTNCNSSSQGRVRLSFGEARAHARKQIGLDTKGTWVVGRDQAEELALIMTEVYLMDPEFPIMISGDRLNGYIVQEMFGEITESHAKLVIENFNRAGYQIKNKKLYLRTALYNAVFELASHYANQVKVDLG